MRKLLFIFILISITLYACAQETDYEDLPEITTPSGTDGFVIYKGGSGYKMTYSTAFAAIIDSLQIHNDSLLSYYILILATYDSIAWLSDTVFEHNLRLIDLEAAGSPDYGADNQIPFMNGTTDFDYSADLTWDGTKLNIGAGGIIDFASTGASEGVWWGNNTGISEDGNDVITFSSNGTTVWRSEVGALFPSITDSRNLGKTSHYWQYVYAQRYYVDATAYIDYSGTELQLTDGVTGTKTLDELAAGETYTFENGLTESGGTVKWGGTLNEDVLIGGDDLYDVQFGTTGDSLKDFTLLATDNLSMYADGVGIHASGAVDALYLTWNQGAGKGFLFNDAIMRVDDVDNEKGLEYLADYSTNYTARSLPDSAHVATMIATGSSEDSIVTLWEAVFEDITPLGTIAPLNSDTSISLTFGQGNGTSTTPFTTSSIYGSWMNDTSDTLVARKLNVILKGTDPVMTIDVKWHAIFQDGSSVELITGGLVCSGADATTTGEVSISFNNTDIPPGVRVVFTSSDVTTAPNYMEGTLTCSKKNNQW